MTKPKLAFGYGYDPNQMRNGITHWKFIHKIEDTNGKLYTFEPALSFRVFGTLAEIMKYTWVEGWYLRKGETYITNRHFITDRTPEEVVAELNRAIKILFKEYEPDMDYEPPQQKTFIGFRRD